MTSSSANTFVPISKPPAYETDYWQREDDDDGGEITVSYPRYPRTNPHSPAARVPSSVYLGDDDYGYKVRKSSKHVLHRRIRISRVNIREFRM